jgi:hypothetical protein
MSLNNNAAFPIEQPGPYAKGLTKREMFAMAAMQGICSNEATPSRLSTFGEIAQASVTLADALLAALEPNDAN